MTDQEFTSKFLPVIRTAVKEEINGGLDSLNKSVESLNQKVELLFNPVNGAVFQSQCKDRHVTEAKVNDTQWQKIEKLESCLSKLQVKLAVAVAVSSFLGLIIGAVVQAVIERLI